MTIPHAATQTFFAFLQVLCWREVFLQVLKARVQAVRQLMAARPVTVFFAFVLEIDGDETCDADDPTEADEADKPDDTTVTGFVTLGVFD